MGKKILIVDDEPNIVAAIEFLLQRGGHEVLVARDGEKALEIIGGRVPDLVILDIMMPELSGFEVLEALRRDETTAALPVVVLTARGDEADARRGMALGAKRFMNKPFDVRARKRAPMADGRWIVIPALLVEA